MKLVKVFQHFQFDINIVPGISNFFSIVERQYNKMEPLNDLGMTEKFSRTMK